MPVCFTIKETADRLKVSPDTIGRLHKRGLLNYTQVAGRVRVSKTELQRFIAQHTEQQQALQMGGAQ